MLRSVLISGGGIAGPALAHRLVRAGIAVTIVERAPSPRPGGQTVDLRGTSKEVAARMGILDEVRAFTVTEHGTSMWSRRGRRVDLPAELFGDNGPVAEIEIMRDDLAGILARQAAGAEWIFDDAIVELHQDADGIDVIFESGDQRRFDLVVGADGLHSRTRRLAFPGDHLTHLGGYTAYFTAPLPHDLDDGWVHLHAMPGGRTIMVRPDREPGRAKVVLTFRSEPIRFDRKDLAAQRRLLIDHYAAGGWRTAELMAALPDSPDLYLDALARVDLDRYSAGRVVLLGDAAFCGSPLTGQGTAAALVGSYVLGHLLTTTDDHADALARYELIMRPYVTRLQQLPGGGLAMMAPMTGLGIAAGLAVTRTLTLPPFRPLFSIMGPKETTLELPTDDAPAADRSTRGADAAVV